MGNITTATRTLSDLLAAGPCYRPEKIAALFGERREFSWPDVVAADIPAEDKVWVAVHLWLDASQRCLFAAWCARRALSRVSDPDPQSVAACDVAERYARGDATPEELAATRNGAWAAYRSAAAASAAAAAYAAAAYATAAARASAAAASAAAAANSDAAERAAQIEYLTGVIRGAAAPLTTF